MKKFIFILVATISFSTLATAQKSRSNNKSSSNNPRAERKIAIVTEGGWKTMVGTGIVGTYYIVPQLAVDGGLGISLQGLRTGVRARYLFMDDNFSPILGVGINLSNGTFETEHRQVIEPFEIDGQMFDGFTADVLLELNRTIAAQLLTGIEYVSDGGFVLGATIGYRARLNQSWDTEFAIDGNTFDVADGIINSLDRIYGSGLSLGLNLGYAF